MPTAEHSFEQARRTMVARQLISRDIRDPRVLEAMATVPREEFVPARLRTSAYRDAPLPIEGGQTISQPYIVALMAQAVEPRATDRVLEIGTGSGYAAAVLSRIVSEVYTVERLGELASAAERRFVELGYVNIRVRCGDGTQGWPEHAPYDAILAAAAGPSVPRPLLEQLAPGGRLVMPVGGRFWGQQLIRIRAGLNGELATERLGSVAFVPLIGSDGW